MEEFLNIKKVTENFPFRVVLNHILRKKHISSYADSNMDYRLCRMLGNIQPKVINIVEKLISRMHAFESNKTELDHLYKR